MEAAANDATGTVSRIMKVIRVIAEASRPVGIKQVAAATGLPPSTVHRLLELLIGGGFVQKNSSTRKYTVGSDMFWIAHLIAARTPITHFLRPILEEITRKTAETAIFALHVTGQRTITYLAKSNSPQPLRFRSNELHQQSDITASATGLAILAFLPEPEQEEIVSAHARSADPAFRGELAASLAKTRAAGFARSAVEAVDGLVEIAAPARDPAGTVVGAFAVVIPTFRFDDAQTGTYAEALQDAADKLARFAVQPSEG